MTFSLETKADDGEGLRRTEFPSIGDAKIASGVAAGDVYAAAVYEGDSPEFGDGRLVALIGRETGWLDVRSDAADVWWPLIPPEIRRWLTGNAPASLPSFVWVRLAQAGAPLQTVQWDTTDPAGMTVTLSEGTWLDLAQAADPLI
jgi:hypothetical protein